MPIVIKELFASDPLSEALEKINFNFDQIILAGGGPPGPQGLQGPAGVPGTKGDRGDHWQVGGASSIGFTGPTTDHGPYFGTLQSEDLWVDDYGIIWKWQEGPTNAWSNTGVSIKGATGPAGPTGNSQDLVLFQGGSGVLGGQDAFSYLPEIGPTTINSALTDFYTLNQIDKNVLFLGDTNWSRKLVNFSRYDSAGGPISNGSPRMVPKHTIIQSGIDFTGYGGLSIGAYGLTAGTGILSNLSLFRGGTADALPWPSVDANSFFNAGWRIKNESSILSHVFRMQSGRNDIEIQSGDPLSLYGDQSNRKVSLISNTIELKGLNDSGDLLRFVTNSSSSRFRDTLYVAYNTSQLSTALSGNNIVARTPSSRLFVLGNSRIQGSLYVGDLTSDATVDIGYNRTDDARTSINLYSSSSTPTVPEFSIVREAGVNGNATILQTGANSTFTIQNDGDTSTNSGNIILRGRHGGGLGFISFNNQVGEIARFDLVNSRLGIGTTSPLAKFHINAGSNSQTSPVEVIRIQGPNTPANANSAQDIKWQFDSAGSSIIRSYRGSSWDTYLQFLTSISSSNTPTVKMHINSNGRIGMGTASPSARLEVLTPNDVNSLRLSRTGTQTSNTFNNNLEFYYYDGPTLTTANNSVIGSIDFRGNLVDFGDNNLDSLGRRIYVKASDTWGPVVNYAPTELIITNGQFVGTNDGDIIIDSSNNLGIGSPPGSYKLYVQGNSRITGNLYINSVQDAATSSDVLVWEGAEVRKRPISNLFNDLGAFPNKFTNILSTNILTSSDLNNFTDGTTYAQSGLGVINLPEAAGGWDVLSIRKNITSGFQIASKATDTTALFYRRRAFGVFNSWNLIPRFDSNTTSSNYVPRITDAYGSLGNGMIRDNGYQVGIGVPANTNNLLYIYNSTAADLGVNIGAASWQAPDNGLIVYGNTNITDWKTSGNISFSSAGTLYANGPHLDFDINNPTSTATVRLFRKTNSPDTATKGLYIFKANGTTDGMHAFACGNQKDSYINVGLSPDTFGDGDDFGEPVHPNGRLTLFKRVQAFDMERIDYNRKGSDSFDLENRSYFTISNATGRVWRYARHDNNQIGNTTTNENASEAHWPSRVYDRVIQGFTTANPQGVTCEIDIELKKLDGSFLEWRCVCRAGSNSTFTVIVPAYRRFRIRVFGDLSGNFVSFTMLRLGIN